jgi:hypothetical protein
MRKNPGPEAGTPKRKPAKPQKFEKKKKRKKP